MGLFSRRPRAEMAVGQQDYRPTDPVPVTVSLEEGLSGVASAQVEIGYVNGYRYRWAGRRDSAGNFDDNSLLTMGQVGTDYGSERDTDDWVGALAVDLPVSGGDLAAGAHRVDVRLPSWSPGSSSDTVRWEARLRIEHDGREIEQTAGFRVVVPAPDPVPEQVLEQGTSAIANTLAWEITTERASYRVGEEIRGVVRITPREPITKPGELAVQLIRERLSHPVERSPGSSTESMVRPQTIVRKGIVLAQGQTTELPFGVVLPPDLDPSTDGVHSSLRWWVQGRLMFEGLTGGVERARLGIVVHTG